MYGFESYVTSGLARSQKSVVALLRTASLPLSIEEGRFKNIQEESKVIFFFIVHNTVILMIFIFYF